MNHEIVVDMAAPTAPYPKRVIPNSDFGTNINNRTIFKNEMVIPAFAANFGLLYPIKKYVYG